MWEWNELFLALDKDALGFRPGPGPRALGYLGIAAYEVCVPGMPNFNSLKNLSSFQGSNIPELTNANEIHYPSAVNAAYAYLMSKLFEKVSYFQSARGSHIANTEAGSSCGSRGAFPSSLLAGPQPDREDVEQDQELAAQLGGSHTGTTG